jgi:hypothetical protein
MMVDEQAPLWEVPVASTIVEGASVVRSGPWSASDWSRVLRGWLETGFIGLYRNDVDSNASCDLTTTEAYLALERFERWRPEEPAVRLFATEMGMREPHEAWVRAGRGGETRPGV